MKTERILAYIDIMIDLIDKDTSEFAKFIDTRTKSQKRTHRIKSDYAHALLIETARKVLNE